VRHYCPRDSSNAHGFRRFHPNPYHPPLSPLKFGHIHLKGRYRFAVDDSSLSDGVRKLRDPDELEE
jgi:hypothetical protein